MPKFKLSRRTVLRCAGLAGASIALPPLEAMVKRPGLFYGSNLAEAEGPPKKLIIFHWPQGVPVSGRLEDQGSTWFPFYNGLFQGELTPALAPLENYKNLINVICSLTYEDVGKNVGNSHGHAPGVTTGFQPWAPKDYGADPNSDHRSISAGLSVDQLAGNKIGVGKSPVKALTTCLYGEQYEVTPLCWARAQAPGAPNPVLASPALWDPKAVFTQVFQGNISNDPAASQALAKKNALKQSILNFAKDDISFYKGKLGKTDQQRLDEHLQTISEIESRITGTPVSCNDASAYETSGKSYDAYSDEEAPQYAKLMIDMHVLALRCNITHVSFNSMGVTGTDRKYPFAGVNIGHHCIAHSGNGCEVQGQARTNAYNGVVGWYMKQFAYLLDELSKPDATGNTLLDQSAVIAFSEFGDAGGHSVHYVPFIVAGKAGRTGANAMPTGQNIFYRCEYKSPNSQGYRCDATSSISMGAANSLPGAPYRTTNELWQTALQAVGALKPGEVFGEPSLNTKPLAGLWLPSSEL